MRDIHELQNVERRVTRLVRLLEKMPFEKWLKELIFLSQERRMNGDFNVKFKYQKHFSESEM